MRDVFTAASSQARRAGVRAITHPPDHLLHPLPGRLRDATPAAQDVGNRLRRDVGGARHVVDGDPGFVRHKICLDFSASDEILVTLCCIDKPHHSEGERPRPSAARAGGCSTCRRGFSSLDYRCVRSRFRPFRGWFVRGTETSMPENIILVVERMFDQSSAELFRAWTEPGQLARWRGSPGWHVERGR